VKGTAQVSLPSAAESNHAGWRTINGGG